MVVFVKPPKEFHQHYGVEVGNRKIEYVGEWRKGIAIGYSKDPMGYEYVPNLINKDGELLYSGYACHYYVEEIHRTSKGFYIVTGYTDYSAPGKDPDYRGPFLKYVISEDGRNKIRYNKKDYFIPKEMGLGIVENENSFYQLDDFKKLFKIPKKFVIESIFEDGMCLLSVPEDNRDFIVTVKANEIVDYVEVNDADKLFKLISKTNDASLIFMSTNDKSPAINAFMKQQKQIEEQKKKEHIKRLKEVYYYSASTYPRNYISEKLVTVKEFEDGIIISEEELKTLQGLYEIVCKEEQGDDYEHYSFHLRKKERSNDECLDCFFYSDFMILRIRGDRDGLKMYRFYSLDGKSLSDKVFFNVQSTKAHTKIEEDKNFYNHFFYYNNNRTDCGIVVIKDKVLIDNSFPDFMFNKEKHGFFLTVNENYITYNKEKYDFYYNKIQVNYVDVIIEEVIKNYLYRMKPDFQTYTQGFNYFTYYAYEKYVDGELYLPFPRKLDTIASELYYNSINRPNFIKEVSHIGDYVDDKEEYSLYLFKCRPHAYCDTKGNVFYDFNPNKINL